MNSGQTFVLLMTTLICATVVVLGTVKAIVGRNRKKQELGSPIEADVSNRLGRMEQAIDSIAVEVERVSQAQRFVTKILAERKQAQPSGALPERVDPTR
jgi:hypothetical protein